MIRSPTPQLFWSSSDGSADTPADLSGGFLSELNSVVVNAPEGVPCLFLAVNNALQQEK